MAKRLTIKSVKHGMTGSICNSRASVRLTTYFVSANYNMNCVSINKKYQNYLPFPNFKDWPPKAR